MTIKMKDALSLFSNTNMSQTSLLYTSEKAILHFLLSSEPSFHFLFLNSQLGTQ